jgi:DNA-binding transcriptional ArsR family regulator
VTDVTEVLSALADPTRRDLLERLSVRGESTATALAGDLPISRQAVVQHLGVLGSVGLVQGRREGREHRFIVCTEPLVETMQWMEKLSQQWDRRLKVIQQIAEASNLNRHSTIQRPNHESEDSHE